jgi:hypothetical protein
MLMLYTSSQIGSQFFFVFNLIFFFFILSVIIFNYSPVNERTSCVRARRVSFTSFRYYTLQDDIIDGGPSYIYDEILIDNRSHALEPIGFWRTINIILIIIIIVINWSWKIDTVLCASRRNPTPSRPHRSPFHDAIPAIILSLFFSFFFLLYNRFCQLFVRSDFVIIIRVLLWASGSQTFTTTESFGNIILFRGTPTSLIPTWPHFSIIYCKTYAPKNVLKIVHDCYLLQLPFSIVTYILRNP